MAQQMEEVYSSVNKNTSPKPIEDGELARSGMETLPAELLRVIMTHLDMRAIRVLRLVSKALRAGIAHTTVRLSVRGEMTSAKLFTTQLQVLPQLTHITLSLQSASEMDLLDVPGCLPRVRDLSLSALKRDQEADPEGDASGLVKATALTSLTLSREVAHLGRVLGNRPALQHLQFKSWPADVGVSAFSALPNLRVLTTQESPPAFWAEVLPRIGELLPSLQMLGKAHVASEGEMEGLGALSALTSLHLAYGNVSLNPLSRLRGLQVLSAEQAKGNKAWGHEGCFQCALSPLQTLEVLRLRGNLRDAESVQKGLAMLSCLTCLDLSAHGGKHWPVDVMHPSNLPCLGNLRWLTLSSGRVAGVSYEGSADWSVLSKATRLEVLWISGLEGEAQEAVKSVAQNLTTLTTLCICD